MRDLKLVWLPCLVLLTLTVPHLEQGDFRRDTGRYAAVGLYMWSGGSPLQPHLHPDTLYFNKPPLAVAIHGAFLKIFGPSLAAARVPSILAALGVVALTVLTARRIGSRAEAVVSGLVLASTYDFFRRTREISLDLWQLLFVMVAVYAAATALRNRSRAGWLWAGIPLGLALLCKPVNALGVIPVFALWALLTRQLRALPVLGLGTLPLALAVAAPWHAYMWATFGDAFVRRYFLLEVVDRARGLRSTAPFYFYLQSLAARYWPWLVGLVWSVRQRWRRARPARAPQRDLVLLGGVWVLFVGGCLSLFPDKKVNYLMPVFPMLSWMAAAGICRLPGRRLRSWYVSGFRGLAPAAAVVLIAASVLPIQFQKPASKDWQGVFAWLKENRIETSRVYYGTLEHNDVCYFYLKTGLWPRSASEIDAREAAGSVILTRTGPEIPAPAPAAVRFSVGEFTLVAGTNPVPARMYFD